MNRRQWCKLVDEVYQEVNRITITKGAEYTNDGDDQLTNFKDEARELGVSPITVWAVLFSKHVRSIRTWARDQITGKTRSYSESIESRILDAIVYLMLLLALIRDSHRPVIASDQPPDGGGSEP